MFKAEPRKGPGEAEAAPFVTRRLTPLGSPGQPLWRAEPRKGPGEAEAAPFVTRRLTPLGSPGLILMLVGLPLPVSPLLTPFAHLPVCAVTGTPSRPVTSEADRASFQRLPWKFPAAPR